MLFPFLAKIAHHGRVPWRPDAGLVVTYGLGAAIPTLPIALCVLPTGTRQRGWWPRRPTQSERGFSSSHVSGTTFRPR